MTTVMIIDDNEAILKSVGLLLEAHGYTVIKRNGSGDIVKQIEHLAPDVILIDYLLSGKSGADVVTEMKQKSNIARIPVIAISAHPSAHLQMAEEGVYSFLQKPFDGETLVRKVEQMLVKR